MHEWTDVTRFRSWHARSPGGGVVSLAMSACMQLYSSATIPPSVLCQRHMREALRAPLSEYKAIAQIATSLSRARTRARMRARC
ncbi:uncharacterized protein LAESUDRAFT_723704 [Laetiporus sulphureus 93-53]|uniref:Uncharacterized protein n=1 Tax=Laetiporus sulphureus 93-53 TaxID=1314785 RepID=A0A165FCP7_9APHY|nr:uncharacterized protein LAESUDRAFT_723704 [Laetiporus sulphureus 93-53]KZT08769.1 hypothetical protein LAESUDRAFT_723704 [Laetiporus sulphureus 93-53]